MLGRVLGEAALPKIDQHAATLARAILERRATSINAREVRRDRRLPGLREAVLLPRRSAPWRKPIG